MPNDLAFDLLGEVAGDYAGRLRLEPARVEHGTELVIKILQLAEHRFNGEHDATAFVGCERCSLPFCGAIPFHASAQAERGYNDD